MLTGPGAERVSFEYDLSAGHSVVKDTHSDLDTRMLLPKLQLPCSRALQLHFPMTAVGWAPSHEQPLNAWLVLFDLVLTVLGRNPESL